MSLKNYSRSATRPDRYFSHSITITGATGVGTTTTLEELQKKLGRPWRFVSAGEMMRARAKQLGVSLEELLLLNRDDPSNDHECDNMITEFGTHNYTVIEGRLPHVFVSPAFHVLLTCPLNVRAQRRLKHGSSLGKNLDEVARLIETRDREDRARYQNLYPGGLWPDTDFDLVIDTSQFLPERIVSQIIDGRATWIEKMGDRVTQDICLD